MDKDKEASTAIASLFNVLKSIKVTPEHIAQRGVDSNLARGKSSGMPKWGYNRDEVTGVYKPDDNFAFIKRGFYMYLEGYSQRDIVAFWRQNDVHRMTKLTHKNKNVRRINVYDSESPIGTILSDPFYYDILVQGGQRADLREILPDFQPMITEEEFGLAQARRCKIKKIPTASVKAKDDKVFISFSPARQMRCLRQFCTRDTPNR